ncbi:DUF7525 family protein [Haloarcula litorea]|uniref:DUF7525 family protein n=1 Tax=Haloarcula litorea TaxID=3032579 RepID=UPI0023E7DC3A|nr:hypothetical protein [Halomicroarcula sp. GDY20]
MATESHTDMGLGLGLLFGLVAVAGAAVTGITSYTYAIRHAQELETTGLLANSGIAFGVAVFGACLAIVAVHAYDA